MAAILAGYAEGFKPPLPIVTIFVTIQQPDGRAPVLPAIATRFGGPLNAPGSFLMRTAFVRFSKANPASINEIGPESMCSFFLIATLAPSAAATAALRTFNASRAKSPPRTSAQVSSRGR